MIKHLINGFLVINEFLQFLRVIPPLEHHFGNEEFSSIFASDQEHLAESTNGETIINEKIIEIPSAFVVRSPFFFSSTTKIENESLVFCERS